MKSFVDFLLKNVYQAQSIAASYCEEAFDLTCLDVQYHFSDLKKENIEQRIIQNQNELAVYLFRLGSVLHKYEQNQLKWQIHWLLKSLCACEIYFNNIIDTGFYVIHGEGTVIGSRNVIGKGFKIHQGCTIGHKKNGAGDGNRIGDDVTLYANSSIIGALNVGSRVIIGGHVMVFVDVKEDEIVTINNKKGNIS